jgi:hypothetical protein
MRTLLGIFFLLAFVSWLPAQDFEGMGYVKAGGELLGPIKIKQNVGGSISIGEWPKTTFFIFDEYSAVLDESRNLLFEGGLPASAMPGEKFMAEKEKFLNANFTPSQVEEEVTATEPSAPTKQEETVAVETSDPPKAEKKSERQKKKKDSEQKGLIPKLVTISVLVVLIVLSVV